MDGLARHRATPGARVFASATFVAHLQEACTQRHCAGLSAVLRFQDLRKRP